MEAESRSGPADLAAVRGWLLPLSAAVRQAPLPDEFAARAGAVAHACSDLPAWAFDAEALKLAMTRFQWFPSAADVHKLLDETSKARRDTIKALRALSEAEPAKPEAEPMHEDERKEVAEHVRAILAIREAETAAAGRMEERSEVKPNHPRPDQLEAIRAGNPIIQKARGHHAAAN
jgi:hypothetical protein